MIIYVAVMRINSLIYIKSMEKYQHIVDPICGDSAINLCWRIIHWLVIWFVYMPHAPTELCPFRGEGRIFTFFFFFPVFTFVFPLLCTVCLLHSSVKTIILQQYVWIYFPCESRLILIPRATGFQEGLLYTSEQAGCACSDINIAHFHNWHCKSNSINTSKVTGRLRS